MTWLCFYTMASNGQLGTPHILLRSFWHPRTLKGPTISLPNIPTQNITPTPSLLTLQSCWIKLPFTNHTELHPSGPVFICFWAHCKHFSLWALVRGGWINALCTTASFWRIIHWEALWTIAAFLILLICWQKTLSLINLYLTEFVWAPNLTYLCKDWPRFSFCKISINQFQSSERSFFLTIMHGNLNITWNNLFKQVYLFVYDHLDQTI